MQNLSKKWIFLDVPSLGSIIFGGGNSNIKWRPCLKAFLSILFRKIFKHFKSIISGRKRSQNTQVVASFNIMYANSQFSLMLSNIYNILRDRIFPIAEQRGRQTTPLSIKSSKFKDSKSILMLIILTTNVYK